MNFLLPSMHPARGRKCAFWLVSAALLAGVLLFLRKPALEQFRFLRQRKLVAEAEAYLAQNRKDEALAAGRAALALGAANPRVYRVMLELLEGKPEAVKFWMALSNHPEVSIADRRELLKWALLWGQIDWAETQWSLLRRERPLSLDTLRAGARYYEAKGEPGKAVLFAQAVLERNSSDTETRMLLGRVLLRDGSERDAQIGKRLLLEQAQRQDSTGLQVLRALSQSGALTPFEAARCREWLDHNPRRGKVDLLTRAGFECQITPYKKPGILARAAREFAPSGIEWIELGRWLASREAFAEFLEAIPPSEARKSPELFALYLDALGARGRWNEVEKYLNDPASPLDSMARALYRARAALALNQERIAGLHWQQARDVAGSDPRLLLRLGQYAKHLGALEEAEQAFRRLAETKYALRGYSELLKLCGEDLEKSRVLLEEMTRKFPDEPSARNDLAYVNLLLDQEIDAAAAAAEALVREHPDFLSYRTTLALARLKKKDFDGAKRLYDEVPINWREALPYQAAVHGAVLAAACGLEAAREIFQRLESEKLPPALRALIENAPARARVAP